MHGGLGIRLRGLRRLELLRLLVELLRQILFDVREMRGHDLIDLLLLDLVVGIDLCLLLLPIKLLLEQFALPLLLHMLLLHLAERD